MRPIIGVTTNCVSEEEWYYHRLNNDNLNAIWETGGIPIMLPMTNNKEDIADLISTLDGVFLTGGIDIAPLAYGENPIKELSKISVLRDEFEIELYKQAFKLHMPILGICRGCQVINVASGGTLYQDIYAQRPNTNGHNPENIHKSEKYHNVNISEGSILHSIFGEKVIQTNSFHHQAVKELAPGFSISALADDGIIEAFEMKDYPFLVAVQWHPECMFNIHKEYTNLFTNFVKKAGDYKKATV